jgi:mannose-1-phosphate guanylyltransferase/phosphomannomutase
VLPDAGEPVVHIYANGIDNGDRDGQKWVEHHMQEFRKHIESFCKLQVALSKDTALLDAY